MKTIALIEIGNDGHRETYMRYFIHALLSLDCRVVCGIPDPDPVRLWVERELPEQAARVTYCALPFFRDRFPHSGRWQERLNAWYNWRHIHSRLQTLEQEQGLNIDLVFLNYLDPYLISYTPLALMQRLLPRKWAGLYCFPATLRLEPQLLQRPPGLPDRDYQMLAPNCRAIAFHDEDIRQAFSERIGKPVLYFPEIADLSAPETAQPLALEIREKARGRTVLGNIGLEKHKGNYELMRLAKLADPTDYYFVFTGRDDGTLYDFLSPEQAAELRNFTGHLPENCLWAPAQFKDDAAYNAVLNAFDILYMVYTHFYGASNRLTKAVHFGKPVLADAAYCIGSTVRQYGLGETVPDTLPETLLDALGNLRQGIAQGNYPGHAWPQYLQDNSREALRRRFAELLELL